MKADIDAIRNLLLNAAADINGLQNDGHPAAANLLRAEAQLLLAAAELTTAAQVEA